MEPVLLEVVDGRTLVVCSCGERIDPIAIAEALRARERQAERLAADRAAARRAREVVAARERWNADGPAPSPRTGPSDTSAPEEFLP